MITCCNEQDSFLSFSRKTWMLNDWNYINILAQVKSGWSCRMYSDIKWERSLHIRISHRVVSKIKTLAWVLKTGLTWITCSFFEEKRQNYDRTKHMWRVSKSEVCCTIRFYVNLALINVKRAKDWNCIRWLSRRVETNAGSKIDIKQWKSILLSVGFFLTITLTLFFMFKRKDADRPAVRKLS